VKNEYGIDITPLSTLLTPLSFDAVILAVAHDLFKTMDVSALVRPGGVIYDVKGVLPRDIVDGRL
jgi:UDP-N-acetyl-D-galactosamine dehydrogenase